ncbi:uncharacterized protein ALTATR162_LOCUS217 [Alternaria atra]|uniref:Uncharacterized protein n=1 Tax=Alternaria atra TaxID=119953 RepID=A0A8J2HU17_9PLEO|nr:uncharacterized protein ALTATR162_LOCUS217 [Alternaria atra]CAG5137819.1 unnamed protein product [Alternaria atra]
MALSIVAGTSGLVQLGLSISDIALCVDLGKKFGNFVRVGQNDNDLFDVLGEDREALFKRHGLVDALEMEKRWFKLNIVHQGERKQGPSHSPLPEVNQRRKKEDSDDGVDRFTWVMVAIVSALDECLPSSEVQELLIRVFVEVLARDDDITTALRITIKKNIESWRSFGCAREIAHSIQKEMRKSLSDGVSEQILRRAIIQLNEAEMEDMKNMLVWLLNGDVTVFRAMSPITFAIAEAWKKVKLDLCTDGNPIHERQACVTYHHEGQLFERSRFSTIPPLRGLGSKALQISWPRDKPESMIDVLGVGRSLENTMSQAWKHGEVAAGALKLIGKADEPYGYAAEVYYILQVSDGAHVSKRYNPHIGMLADQGFPLDTEEIHKTLEWILIGEPADSSRWLHNHVAQDYLLKVDNVDVVREPQYNSVYFKYQAFIFGIYYGLLRQLLHLDLVEAIAFFHGIWGTYSTTFLAMCTQLGRCLRRDEKASRAHILYVLAAMYNGRRKIFNTSSTIPRLVGVLGPISLLALPLVRTTDDPSEISKIAVVDLPIVDLNADSADGDLMASEGGGIRFDHPGRDDEWVSITQPPSPTNKWTIHPYMSMALRGGSTSGVVMAARCGKRLVGWFNPLAADVSFLSTAYVKESYSDRKVDAFEIKDEHWEASKALQHFRNDQATNLVLCVLMALLVCDMPLLVSMPSKAKK